MINPVKSFLTHGPALSTMSPLSVQTTQDKAGFLPPASRDYVMLFAIFLKSGFASIEFQK